MLKETNTRTKILEATWHLMEEQQGQDVTMSKIAKKAGISRQALYLHFESRIELIISTVNYVDEVKGLKERLLDFEKAKTGVDQLEACVDVWANYIPEIYGIAKAMLSTRETDEASKIAWEGCMESLRSVCKQAIETLDEEGNLAENWTIKTATELFWTTISIHSWEQLINECGWTNKQYISSMKILLKNTFVKTC